MKCEEIELKILSFIDGELSHEETDQFLEHIKSCKNCSDLLEEYQNQERLLDQYFQSVSKSAIGIPKPVLEEKQRPHGFTSRFMMYVYPIAAVFVFLFLSGVSLLVYHEITKSSSGKDIGTALTVIGKVQYIDGKELKPVTEGMKINSNIKLKTTNNSYLALQIQPPKKSKQGNIIEFKGNSSGTFLSFKERNVLAMDHGEVWVHFNEKPNKTIDIKTKQLLIRDKGTIFNVTQGLSGSSVSVLDGSVEFDYKGEHTVLEAGQSFSTIRNSTVDEITAGISYSHFT